MQYMNEKIIFVLNIIETMEGKKKQERKVVHLQIGDKHLYELGISYYKTKNNLSKMGTITTDKCVIRQGYIITKPKKR